jgi:hypothetical protein
MVGFVAVFIAAISPVTWLQLDIPDNFPAIASYGFGRAIAILSYMMFKCI